MANWMDHIVEEIIQMGSNFTCGDPKTNRFEQEVYIGHTQNYYKT